MTKLIQLNETTSDYVSVQIVGGEKKTIPQPVWINPDHIKCIREGATGALIYLNDAPGDDIIVVTEHPQRIWCIIRDTLE